MSTEPKKLPEAVGQAVVNILVARGALGSAGQALITKLKELPHHEMVDAVMTLYWGFSEEATALDLLPVLTYKELVGANSTPQFHKLAQHYRPLKSGICAECKKPMILCWSRHSGWEQWDDRCGSCRDKEVMRNREHHNEISRQQFEDYSKGPSPAAEAYETSQGRSVAKSSS